MRHLIYAAAIFALAGAAGAEETDAEDTGGTLNPEELTLNRMTANARGGHVDMVTCASGYMMTKKGDHEAAREVFTACAEAGYAGAMTWISQLDDNGLGAPEDPEAATDWSRRAAEAGDEIGQFNYGVALLRGRGVARDVAQGRALVDQAARSGLGIAQRLRAENYDLDEITPDADAWKYAPRLY